LAVVGWTASAIAPDSNPAKNVVTSQSAIVARAVVAECRLTVESRIASANHSAM
jgi:hypothetical protein